MCSLNGPKQPSTYFSLLWKNKEKPGKEKHVTTSCSVLTLKIITS